jgi:hypothetical protein
MVQSAGEITRACGQRLRSARLERTIGRLNNVFDHGSEAESMQIRWLLYRDEGRQHRGVSMKDPLVLLSLLLSMASPSALRNGQEVANPGTPVKVTRFRSYYPVPWSFESDSGIPEPLQVVIRDGETWREMWKRIYRWSSPLPLLPKIDFSKETVVVVALGGRPSGGYGIIIDRACERDDRLEIFVSSHSPGKGCFLTGSITAPVDIVMLPKTERSVVFRETEVVHDCR